MEALSTNVFVLAGFDGLLLYVITRKEELPVIIQYSILVVQKLVLNSQVSPYHSTSFPQVKCFSSLSLISLFASGIRHGFGTVQFFTDDV